MKKVTPKVFMIAQTKLEDAGVYAWLKHFNAESLVDQMIGSSGEQLSELAGRRCYLSFKEGLNANVTRIRKDSEQYHTNVLNVRHGSVLEHSTVTFAFENVSRVFTHELVRHRAGCAMSQESLRFVRLTDLKFWMPGIIEEFGEEKALKAAKLFEDTVGNLEETQKDLFEIFDIDNMKDFGVKKKLTSMFRRLAPIGLSTGIVFTANFRAWRHILQMRCSPAAEEEIKLVMDQVCEKLKEEHPMIFGDFEKNEDGFYIPKHDKV